jgi:hypothetical protein
MNENYIDIDNIAWSLFDIQLETNDAIWGMFDNTLGCFKHDLG